MAAVFGAFEEAAAITVALARLVAIGEAPLMTRAAFCIFTRFATTRWPLTVTVFA